MISRIATIGAIALIGSLSVISPAVAADESKALTLDVRIDDQKVDGSEVRLDPARPVRIDLRVQNRGSSAAQIRTVRLSGTALGLTFFAYDTSVALSVPAGETATQGFTLDLSDLDSQVTGLLPTTVAVLDQDRSVLAKSDATADVRGSLVSVYGMFGIAVLLMTAFSWGAALFALARQRLPANRWRRALRFLPAGVGTGLTAVITLSVLRFVAPSPLAEIPLVLVAGAVGFGLGYLTPTPDDGGTSDAETTQETPALVQPQGGLA